MAFIKPATLSFLRVKVNTNGSVLDESQLRYILIVDGTELPTEHIANVVGSNGGSIPLTDIPDVVGDHTIAIKCKNLVNSLVSAVSAAITVTVVDDSLFPPVAPSGLSAA